MQSVEPKEEKRQHLKHFRQLFPCMHNAMQSVEPKTREKTTFETFPTVPCTENAMQVATHKATQEKRRQFKTSLFCYPHFNYNFGSSDEKPTSFQL